MTGADRPIGDSRQVRFQLSASQLSSVIRAVERRSPSGCVNEPAA